MIAKPDSNINVPPKQAGDHYFSQSINALNAVIVCTRTEMPLTHKSNQLPVTGMQGFKNGSVAVYLWYCKLQGIT